MAEFFQWTAWPMERPAAYGAFHLIFFLGGLAVLTALAWLLRRANGKQNRIILLTVGIFLILTEVYKHLFYFFVVHDGREYPWWIFPFQLCSIPMYLCIIAPLLRPGKVQSALYDFMLAFNLMGGFIAFLEPSGLTHEYWTLTLHAFVWHLLIVFVGLYLGFSRRAGRQLKDYRRAIIVFGILCVVAFSINLALRGISDGSVNMFYIGPSDSPIIVFKDICKMFGWYVNTPLYIGCLCLAAFLFFLPFTLWNKHLAKKEK